ncbi:GNAT family N-acetyltransferase [Qipengyuania sp. JC766]|uniref:GNAT family N-acetyltransferase n=1 Tax=Qipengyuania sp. JC766 TaxID=3232139 RepID=UPI0034586EA7
MVDVTIRHEVRDNGGRYVAEPADSDSRGHLDWEPRGTDVRIATHTIVPREIGGRGIAGQLVDALVADAREQGFKIDPQCSYVAAKFDDNPEWADLRA